MEQPAQQPQPSWNPIVDTPEWRAENSRRVREFIREIEAEYGPADPAKLAEVQAKLDSTES